MTSTHCCSGEVSEVASFAEWHLIQFTHDLRRREPRNIGVAATDGTDWQLRLVGVDTHSAEIDGRGLKRFHLLKDDYAPWVRYFRSMVTEGRIEQIQRSLRRRPTEFRLVAGGRTELHTPLTAFIDTLFAEMVARDRGPAAEDRATILRNRVEEVLRSARIHPDAEDAVVEGRWDDQHDDQIRFDYSYTNGRLHLMDRLQLGRNSIEQSKVVARDFNARVRAVMEAGTASSFIAFYSGEVVDEIGDAVLAPLWKVGHIVDVDRPKQAATDLRDYIYS